MVISREMKCLQHLFLISGRCGASTSDVQECFWNVVRVFEVNE